MVDIDIEKEFWAIPIHEYIESFNSQNDVLNIAPYFSTHLNYVHLNFRPIESLNSPLENIVYYAVIHPDDYYHISGNLTIKPIEFQSPEENKKRANEIAKLYFNKAFSTTDEEKIFASPVTPSPLPHLIHRYDKHGENTPKKQYRDSELYFETFFLADFSKNPFESQISRFQEIIERVDT